MPAPRSWIRPTRPDTANVLRSLTGRYHDVCVNSFRKRAFAAMKRNAYSTEAVVKKPRCGLSESSRLSQKNAGVRLEMETFVASRSRPGSSAFCASAQRSPFLLGSMMHCAMRYS